MITSEQKFLYNLAKYGTGQSSIGILKKHLNIKDLYPTPSDIDDLIRCITMTTLIGININIMKDISQQWNNIIYQWDILCILAENKNNIERINKLLNSANEK